MQLLSGVAHVVWNPRRHAVLYATLLGIGTLFLDYVTGPFVRFPVLFVFPVVMAAWYRGWRLGLVFAVVPPALGFVLTWHWAVLLPQRTVDVGVTAAVRIVGLGALAYFTARHRVLEQHVGVLRGILPICSFCKKIQDRHGNWEMMENYIRRHSEAEFSHGLCPTCAQQHYGDIFKSSGRPPAAS